jgi:hypothetical protein
MSFPRLAIPLFLPLVAGFVLLTGACAAPLALTGASYAADGGLLVASNKTSTDHFVSMVSNKDCALWRVLRGRAVCKEREGEQNPYDVDYTQPQRMVGEDGVQYAPPLHAAADAPATSWDAAAYKSAPAPAAPAAPVTAVADAAPDPAPAAAPAAAPKPKKPKVRSAKKPHAHMDREPPARSGS